MDLYIPKKIKVGFQKRSDTFDSKLGFVIYYDENGILKNEKRWNTWRNESIEPLTLENKPFKNANLHKGVKYTGTHFSDGKTTLRIYDSREFEYEISFDNFVAIASNNEIIKGELIGEFVYAFSNNRLVLLPTDSEEYKQAIKDTENINTDLKEEDLIPGNEYHLKKNIYGIGDSCIYIGKYNFNEKLKDQYIPINGKESLVFYANKNFTVIDLKNIGKVKRILEDLEFKKYLDVYLNSILMKKIETLYFKNFDFTEDQIKFLIENNKLKGILFGYQKDNYLNNFSVTLSHMNTYDNRNYYVDRLSIDEYIFKKGIRNKKYSTYLEQPIYLHHVNHKQIFLKEKTFNNIEIVKQKYNELSRVSDRFENKKLANVIQDKQIEVFKLMLEDWKESKFGVLTYKFEDGSEETVLNCPVIFDIKEVNFID